MTVQGSLLAPPGLAQPPPALLTHPRSLVGASPSGVWDLFCGFYKPQPIIPKGWIWMYWLDPGAH